MKRFYANGWNIPNSRMIITHRINFDKDNVGIIIKPNRISQSASSFEGYICFGANGDNVFNASENLMEMMSRFENIFSTIFDKIDINAEVIENDKYWTYPKEGDDFDKECFSAFYTIDKFDKADLKFCFYHRHSDNKLFQSGYSGALLIQNDSIKQENPIFMGCPDYDKNIALIKFRNAVCNCGKMIEILQKGAWDVMINNDAPDLQIIIENNKLEVISNETVLK